VDITKREGLRMDKESKDVIVIECEVEHSRAWTIIKKEPGDGKGNLPNRLVIPGHHGTDGEEVTVFVARDG